MVSQRSAEQLEGVCLRDLLTTSALLLEQTTKVGDAAELFAVGDCDTLVVIKPDGKLLGVLMARDVCRLCV